MVAGNGGLGEGLGEGFGMIDNYDCFLVVSARLSLGLSAWISYS
jgi:hypothetical protein